MIRHFKSEFPMKACAFSPSMYHPVEKLKKFHLIMGGGIIARDTAKVSQGGYEIHIMDLKCQEEIGKVEGHFGPINWITYHKDGNGFITAGEEGIVRIYRF